MNINYKSMKIVGLVILSILALSLSACGWRQTRDQGQVNTSEENNGRIDYNKILDVIDKNVTDNSMDRYSRVTKGSLELEFNDYLNGEVQQGASNFILGNNRGSYFAKHIYEDKSRCWDEIRVRLEDGEQKRVKLSFQDYDYNQAFSVGAIWNSNQYIMNKIEKNPETGGYAQLFFETDEDFNIISQFTVDFLRCQKGDFEVVLDLVEDCHQFIHFLTYVANEGWRYYVTDLKGTEIYSDPATLYDGYERPRLQLLYNGEAALLIKGGNSAGSANRVSMTKYDAASEKMMVISEFSLEGKDSETYYTLYDENTVLYANTQGIFVSDFKGANEETLYRFSNHGMGVTRIAAMLIREDKGIELIYYDAEEMPIFAYFSPTIGEVEQKTIELVVSPSFTKLYSKAVLKFNQDFPAYFIKIVTENETDKLAAEMVSGKGPVLVDSSLLGFEENKKLWLQLDDMMDQMGLTSQLNDKALEMGKIDQKLYGIITNYWIETVVAYEKDKHWNYRDFLNQLEATPEITSVCSSSTLSFYLTRFFIRNKDDAYMIENVDGSYHISPQKLQEMIESYRQEDYGEEEQIKPWPYGSVLCNEITIMKPKEIELFRSFYGEKVNFIGYPSDVNEGHYLNAYPPLTIRCTATVEEQAIAFQFFKYLLSYDVQINTSKTDISSLSIRNDVLEEQFMEIGKVEAINKFGYPTTMIENLDIEKDKKIFYEILDKAQPGGRLEKGIRSILYEEISSYENNEIGMEETISAIVNRVQLFLDENS